MGSYLWHGNLVLHVLEEGAEKLAFWEMSPVSNLHREGKKVLERFKENNPYFTFNFLRQSLLLQYFTLR